MDNANEQRKALLELADEGYASAQETIGKLYYDGSGCFEKDLNSAMFYFRKLQHKVMHMHSGWCTLLQQNIIVV